MPIFINIKFVLLNRDKNITVPQIEFSSLENFIKNSNNFHAHFLDDSFLGKAYRSVEHFKRFKVKYPQMEKELTIAVTKARESIPKEVLPYKQLWIAYKLMSLLVFINDEMIMMGKIPNNKVLII